MSLSPASGGNRHHWREVCLAPHQCWLRPRHCEPSPASRFQNPGSRLEVRPAAARLLPRSGSPRRRTRRPRCSAPTVRQWATALAGGRTFVGSVPTGGQHPPYRRCSPPATRVRPVNRRRARIQSLHTVSRIYDQVHHDWRFQTAKSLARPKQCLPQRPNGVPTVCNHIHLEDGVP